jgi:DNA invertase Pin-like site-specific DNA recombinase
MVVLETNKKTVIATYLLTNSVQETAKELNYSYSWVYRILYKVGLINLKLKKIRQSINNLTESEVNKIATDYLSGMSTKEIQKVHNISTTTLYIILSKLDIPSRKKRRGYHWSKLSREMQLGLMSEVIYLYSEDKSVAEISRQLQIPFSRVRTILISSVNNYEV